MVALVSDVMNGVTSGYVQGIPTPIRSQGVQEFADPIPSTLRGTGTLSATFSFTIPGSARYLTLAATSSGNISADHAVFADIQITAAPQLAGDYDQNGIVDAADYVVWRTNDGTQPGYDAWRANFGRTAGAGSLSDAAVPEPSNWMLLLPLVILASRNRYRGYRERS
jgi:hypothetical protein